jgi:hypothetical protein
MLKSLKTMVEAAKDVTTTEEVAADSEAIKTLVVEIAEAQVAEVSDLEKKVDSEAKEVQLQEKVVSEVKEVLQKDREEKVDSIAITQLQKESLALFREKKELQDVQKVQVINRQVVHLKLLKAEDLEKAKAF